MPAAPAASCAAKKHTSSHYRFNRDTRPSLRNGFNGVVRALPGVRDLIVTVISGFVARRLDASPGASGPHAFAVRSHIVRVKRNDLRLM